MKPMCLIKRILIVFFILLPLLAFISYANAREKITSFHSDIFINEDSSIYVTETIDVICEGIEIKRGIYRDFPTRYRDKFGNKVSVGFSVYKILKDGVSEPYRIKEKANGKRIYIGDKDVYLSPGRYSYEISYKTTRQLGFFDNHDELYWNVTGNGWVFPIEQASASVSLPVDLDEDSCSLEGYIGKLGSKEQNLISGIDSIGSAVYKTSSSLAPYEGLTIVLDFPKGIVRPPNALQKSMFFIMDNVGTIIVFGEMIILFVFYLYFWKKLGKDPKKGTIIPRFKPPKDINPSAIRYIKRMKYDKKNFTSTILNMAVKGYLLIEEKKSFLRKTYEIKKTGADEKLLSQEEREIAVYMPNSIKLIKKNYETFEYLISVLEENLKASYEGIYFKTNSIFTVFGILLAILFIAGPILVFSHTISIIATLPAAMMFILIIIFAYLMKAYTKAGRKLMDEIEGFKMFLTVTQKDRLNILNPPKKTPQLFEKYLPYAVALGVEHKWAKQFSWVFKRIAGSGKEYRPHWYVGSSWNNFHIDGFAGSFGSSFSKAISSSSSPPGSSFGGGGGGGGFSGGGGGGGGGGGW